MYKLDRRNVEIKLCYDHLTKTKGHKSKWAAMLLEHVYFFRIEQNYIYAILGSVTEEQIKAFNTEEASFNYQAIIGNKYDKLMDKLIDKNKDAVEGREQDKIPNQTTLF